MDDLIRDCLAPLLNSDVDNEIVQYVKDMKVREDFEEFIDNVIDKRNPEHISKYNILISALFGDVQQLNPKRKLLYKEYTRTGGHDSIQQKTHTPKSKTKDVGSPTVRTPNSNDSLNIKKQAETSSGKRKAKYVNIKNFDSSVGMKKGRHPCDCEAKIHPLVNNCLKCGRIVCEQEASGPCFFCDTMVCTNEEHAILESTSKESSQLYNRLKEQKTSKEWKKAVDLRDRLIKADRNRDYKSKVYDDQSDYFGTNEGGVHKSKHDMKYALDLATRTFSTQNSDFIENKEQLLKGVDKLLDTTEARFPKNVYEITNFLDKLGFKETVKTNIVRNNTSTNNNLNNVKIANDTFLSEMDRGMCLSMHQPWASLLVAGIKIHEGRTWYTEHRGRLWIHAASKEPDNNEILEVEETYRCIYNDPELVFPKRYPTSCLLGCVFVEDCMNQERYRKLNFNGESESPYVLICKNPMILPIFFPMQGQHKIFPLSKEMHRKAKEALLASNWL